MGDSVFDDIGGKPDIGVDDTFPIEANGSAYRLDGGPLLFVDNLLGGAISAASGSLDAGAGVLAGASAFGVIIGGGASGFATSAGSSPGNIHRFNFSS